MDTRETSLFFSPNTVFVYEGSIQYEYDAQSRLTSVISDLIRGPGSVVIDYTDDNRVFSVTETTAGIFLGADGFMGESSLVSVDYYVHDDIGLLTAIETDQYIGDSLNFEVDSIQTIQWQEGECAQSLVWLGDVLPSFFPQDENPFVRGDGYTYANRFCTHL